jgi:glyoxylase-like metal-dependent hydrolase (beta-lactamase superfamily II)
VIAELAAGIWAVGGAPHGHAAYIVKTNPGAVLIDTGPEPSGATVMQAFQKARVGLRSVRAILLSSADPEASAGARALRERTGARLLSSREEALRLQPLAVDGCIEPGDVVEERLEVFQPAGAPLGRLGFRLLPSGALFVFGSFSLSGARTR